MVSLTKANSVGGRAVTAGRNAGPHYFLRVPSTGFPGKHFLEYGLQVGVAAAQEEFAKIINKELKDAERASFKGFGDSPVAAKAGVNLNVFQNVTTGLPGVNVKAALFKAFNRATRVAKQAAVARFNRLDKGTSPRLSSGRQGSVNQSFHYKTSGRRGGSGAVTMGVQFYGSKGGIAKVIAQNFGLRKPSGAEIDKFKLNTGIT